MSNVDKLFKDKLEDHQLAPSAQAWTKVERNLVKKNNTIVWMRWAAVLALAGLLALYLVNRSALDSPPTLADSKVNSNKEVVPVPKVEGTSTTVTPAVAEEKSSAVKRTPKVAKEAAVQQVAKQETPIALPDNALTENTVVADNTSTASISEAQPTAQVEKQEKSKAVVLTYTLPSRPTVKLEGTLVASNGLGEEKQTGIQKLWEAAKDAKNSDNPWGELREAKNELFALDFKRDKDKTRNQ